MTTIEAVVYTLAIALSSDEMNLKRSNLAGLQVGPLQKIL